MTVGITNAQYDALMRQYSQKQVKSRRELEERRQAAYRMIPELQELDIRSGSESRRFAGLLMDHPDMDLAPLRKELSANARSRRELLAAHGFPADYLDPHYTCPDCQDTGFTEDGRKCHCFIQAQIDLLYTQAGTLQLLEDDSFDHFSLEYYPEDMYNPANGLSSRDCMRQILDTCRTFVREFDSAHANLFFSGGTGLGKTFLSRCIARELLSHAHSVMYYSSFDLFEQMARTTFSRSEGPEYTSDPLTSCDLLIIDDLGTELVNSFTASSLFLLINERLTQKKSTIISTNLTLGALAGIYSERIMSRITSSYQLLYFYGSDIRIHKALKMACPDQ